MKDLKRVFLAVAIIIIVIIFDFIMLNNTKSVVTSMNEKLEEIDDILANGEIPETELEDLDKEWKDKEKFLSCYLEHDEIEKIGDKINLIEKQVEIEDVDDARQTITEAKYLFDHVEEKQRLNIENFF